MKTGRPSNKPTDVWRYVRRGAPDECWPWIGAMRRRGYGAFSVKQRDYVAHRLVFQVSTGVDPGEQFVCHRCDNPSCCNPAHLFLGDATDNVHDMLAKGRGRPPRGTKHHGAKLTEEDVREIRRRAGAGEKLVTISRDFPVGQPRLSVIVRRPEKAWSHV